MGNRIDARTRRQLFVAATLLAAVMGLVSLLRAQGTFSGTFDESNHLSCGLEWWQFGSYTQWTENPPLPRAAVAAIPYLAGVRLPPPPAWDPRTHEWDRSWEVGLDVLYGGDGIAANLRRARLGTVPFFLLALAGVWGLAGGRRRPGAGLVAVALTAALPSLCAHGALATTDVAFVGTFLLALLWVVRWFEGPTRGRAAVLGLAFGLALLCKFSVLAFFPVAVLAMVAARLWAKLPARPVRDGQPLPWLATAGHGGLALLVAFATTWAGYRFSVGRIDDLPWEVKDWLRLVPGPAERGALGAWLLHARLPMPEFFHGLRFLAAHNAAGHEAYLLGKISDHGFWWFYPVALAVKTPLPTLLLMLLSLPWLVRRTPGRWVAPALMTAAMGIVAVALPSRINLGIRHVLFVVPLAIVAVSLTLEDWIASRSGRARNTALALVVVLVSAQAVLVLATARTSLGSFNLLAGRDPAKVLVDSDLDWGQDLNLLRDEARARGVDRLKLAYFGMARQCQHGLPPLEPLLPNQPTTGWIAISENYYRNRSMFGLLKTPCDPKSVYRENEVPRGVFSWLESLTPVTMVGTSIRLYHVP